MDERIIAVTGHRPEKLGGYDVEAQKLLVKIAERMLNAFLPTLVYTGMALGWDQAVARACINNSVPFVAAIPFEGQEGRWNAHSQKIYNLILDRAERVVVVSEGGFSVDKMMLRNKYMVDNAELLVAMWDGSKGGTSNCVTYAQSVNCPVENIYDWYNEIK